ncbi:MAG: DUF47 family protein [Thaumarchaeota archaeon]|nr:DUF47 family protein [Candidatus Calditenuaceae archaeon]MDW8186846.1 DUF47 family protein [Nitrososphaerota archaeon]
MAFIGRQKLEDVRRIVLMTSKDHTRRSIQILRTLGSMLESMVNGSVDRPYLQQKFAEILKMDEECKALKSEAELRILEVGALLVERGDFVRLLGCLDKVPDRLEGVAYRTLGLVELGRPERETLQSVVVLLEKVGTCLESLNRAITALEMDSEQGYQRLKEVKVNEKSVDDVYRRIGIEILKRGELTAQTLLLKEIVDLLESVSDLSEETADILSFLYPVK